MPTEHSKLHGVDRPEPDEALSGTAARTRDHAPSDEDDREVALDDPTQPAVVIDDDGWDPARPDEPAPD